MNATTAPSGPSSHYCQLRAAGSTHAEALHQVGHAYQRTEKELLDGGVARLWEALARSESVADPLPQKIPKPDPMDTIAHEIANRQEALEADRQRLSLDSLGDDAARRDLVKVEREITEVRAEAERVALARLEGAKQEREQADQAKQQARAKALQRADELGEQRHKADARLERAASSFAAALAAVHALSSEQSQAISDSGGGDGSRLILHLGNFSDWSPGRSSRQARQRVGSGEPGLSLIH